MWFDSVYFLIAIFSPLPHTVYTPTDTAVWKNWTSAETVFTYFPQVPEDLVIPSWEVDLTKECSTVPPQICNVTDATATPEAVHDENDDILKSSSANVGTVHPETQFSSAFSGNVQIARVVRPWEHIASERHVGEGAGLVLVLATILYWVSSRDILSSTGLRQLTAKTKRIHNKSKVKEKYFKWLACQEQDILQRERITEKAYATKRQAHPNDTTNKIMNRRSVTSVIRKTQSTGNVNKCIIAAVINRQKRKSKALKFPQLEIVHQQIREKSQDAAAGDVITADATENIMTKTSDSQEKKEQSQTSIEPDTKVETEMNAEQEENIQTGKTKPEAHVLTQFETEPEMIIQAEVITQRKANIQLEASVPHHSNTKPETNVQQGASDLLRELEEVVETDTRNPSDKIYGISVISGDRRQE